ncbi:hypothetical protein NI25_20840 [Streptomyces sp. CCM_MD2014]|nr:hypothetical protein NI25_20840 [Streptomyces sp. CCM_MD2014]
MLRESQEADRQVTVREWTSEWWAGRVVPGGMEDHLRQEVARLGGHGLDRLSAMQSRAPGRTAGS